MADILFRMAAKTDVGLVRTNNEDNFQASADLSQSPMRWVNNQQYSLGPKGALLVVADGMGGMNAGEVASEIAINTVIDMFAPENITDEVARSRQSIEKFMKGVVVEADTRIKQHAKEFPESRGMGTTIVIAWMFDGQTYVTWCGDSRAYIYNPATGLFQISKDHSYVQTLIDDGKLTKEEAFDFPDSNIITRSLCDGGPKAQPECLTIPQPLCNGDIILLCSDGLNGMIRDEEIEKIITHEQNDLSLLVDQLISAAKEAGGADNVTVALAQVTSGGEKSQPGRIPFQKRTRQKKTSMTIDDNGTSCLNADDSDGKSHKGLIITVVSLLLLAFAALAVWRFCPDIFGGKNDGTSITNKDSLYVTPQDNTEPDEVGSDVEGENELPEDTKEENDGEARDETSTQPAAPSSPKISLPVKKLDIPEKLRPQQRNVKDEAAAGGKNSVTPDNSPKRQTPVQNPQRKEKQNPRSGEDSPSKPVSETESTSPPTRQLPPGFTPINKDGQPDGKPEKTPKPDESSKPKGGDNTFTPIPRKGGESSEMIEHVVKEGETLSSILNTNDKKVINEVARLNKINPDHLVPGRHIFILKRKK